MQEQGVNTKIEQHHTRGVTPVRVLLWSRPLRARVIYYAVAQSKGSAREHTHERTQEGKGEEKKKECTLTVLLKIYLN